MNEIRLALFMTIGSTYRTKLAPDIKSGASFVYRAMSQGTVPRLKAIEVMGVTKEKLLPDFV